MPTWLTETEKEHNGQDADTKAKVGVGAQTRATRSDTSTRAKLRQDIGAVGKVTLRLPRGVE